MTPELLVLLAASMVALQIVSLVIRREHVEDGAYLALLVVDLFVLAFVHVTGRHSSMLAFVAEGAAATLTLLPRLLDVLERSALGRDAFGRAAAIALVRELIVPGRTSTRRRRQLDDLAAARAGEGAAVARRLRAEIDRADDPVRVTILREELATVLFFDQRFSEGVDEVERHLGLDHVARRPAFAAYLLRAYGEVGQMDRAAAVMSLIEDGPAGRDPQATGLVVQARLTFLAFSGCLPHVEALLAGEAGGVLPERAHAFLLAVARARAEKEVQLPPEVKALAEAVFSRATLPQTTPAPEPRNRPRITWLLVSANLAAFAVALWLAPVADEGQLVRAGALFRPAVLAGEPWRVFTAMFLHAGWLHLGINMYGLFLLGRFTEDVFGPARYFAVYVGSGLVGALSSTLVGAGALSVGASGAIMGLLGALIVTLILRRGTWPEAWRRTLLWNLVLLGALQIYIGFQVPMIDNAAHVGGMVGGAALALLLAPGGLVGTSTGWRRFAQSVAILLAGCVVASAVMVLRTPLERTLSRLRMREITVGSVRLTVPNYWEIDPTRAKIEDPYLGIEVTPRKSGDEVTVSSSQSEDPRFRALIQRVRTSARGL